MRSSPSKMFMLTLTLVFFALAVVGFPPTAFGATAPPTNLPTAPGSSVTGEVYGAGEEAKSLVLPPPSGLHNYFLSEESFGSGYHYINVSPPGPCQAEGMLRLPASFKVTPHRTVPRLFNNDVPYFFFGIYTAKGGIDVGICWQKHPDYPEGVWLSFCTVFPRSGDFYTHANGAPIPGLTASQVLHMAAVQLDDGVRLELSTLNPEGNLEPLIITEFPISEIGLRRDGRGSYFTREISLAQHELNYTSGAEVIEASWWDAKLTWTNYSSLWDARVTNLMLTHWEPVSEKRLAYFLQTPYHSETVSFIYDANHTTPAGE